MNTETYLESMENQLRSSGLFPRTHNIAESQRDSGPNGNSPNGMCLSMFNGIDLTKKGNYHECLSNSEKVKNFAKRFPLGHLSFLGPREEDK